MMKKIKIRSESKNDCKTDCWIESHGTVHVLICYSELGGDNFYWRLDDPINENLFTIDIDRKNGLLKSFEVNLYNGKVKELEEHLFYDLEDLEGYNHVFTNVSDFYLNKELGSEKFYNYQGVFLLQYKTNELFIRLFDDRLEKRIRVSVELDLFINKNNELCAILVKNLDDDSFNNFKCKYL